MATNIGRLYALIGADTSEFDRKLGSLGKSATTLGKNLTMKLTMPLLAIAGAAVKFGADFEQAMMNAASVSGATQEELKRMEELARRMGATTVFSAKQAADGMYYMASAGWKVYDMEKALEPILNLAAATQSDLAFTTDAVVATLNQFQLGSEGATRVTNVFASAIGNSQATMEKLKISMSYVGPIAHSLNYTLEETTSTLMGLYNAGYDASMAGTSMRMALAKLMEGSKRTQEGLQGLGLSLSDVSPKAYSLAEIIGKLERAGADASDVIKIFGVRAGPAMAALIATGEDAIRKFEETITDTNAATVMAEMQIRTFKGSMKLLTSALAEAAIQIFDILGPVIRDLVDKKIKPAVEWFSKLSTETKENIIKFATFVALIGPSILLFGKLVTVIHTLSASMKTLGAAVLLGYGAYQLLLKAREAYEKATGKWIDQADKETKAWAELNKNLGGFSEIQKRIASEIGKTEGYEKQRAAVLRLQEIWHQYGENTQETLKAIAEGKHGKDLQEMLEKIGGKHLEAAKNAEVESKALDELKGIVEDVNKVIEDALAGEGEAQKKIADARRKAEQAALDEEKALERLAEAEKEYTEYLEDLGVKTIKEKSQRIKELEDVIARADYQLKNNLISLSDYKEIVGKAKTEIFFLTGTVKENVDEQDKFKGGIDLINEALFKQFTLLDGWGKQLRNSGIAAKDAAEIIQVKLYQVLKNLFDLLPFIPNISSVFDLLAKKSKKTGYEIKVDWEDVAKDMANYWSSAMAEMIRDGINLQDAFYYVFQTISRGAGSAVSSMIADLGKIGAAVAPVIGTAVSAILSGLGSLLGIKSKAQKEAEKAAKEAKKAEHWIKSYIASMTEYGEISEGTAEKVKKASEKMAGFAAESKYLADIISDVGVTQENVNDLWWRAGEILGHYQRGFLSASDAALAADESFNLLLEGAKKLGEEGSAAMVDFIIKVRNSGLEVQSVTDYVVEQLDRIPSALETLIASQEKTGQSIAGLELRTLKAFKAMEASGMDWTDIVHQMSPALNALKERMDETGYTGSKAIQKLFKITEVTEANKELFDAIEADRIIMEALGNTGFLTGDILNSFAQDAIANYEELKKKFGNSDDALRAMGPTLQKIQDYAKAYNITLDEGTQKLIDQAVEIGVVKKEQEDNVDLQKRLFKELGQEIGRHMREAAGSIGESIKGAFEGAFGKVKEIAKNTASSINTTLSKIKPLVDIDFKYKLPDFSNLKGNVDLGFTGSQGKIPGFQREGIAWRPTLAKIAERTPEAVVDLGKLAAGTSRFSGLFQGGQGRERGDITMHFNGPLLSTTGVSRADLEQAGETLFQIVKRQMKRLGG